VGAAQREKPGSEADFEQRAEEVRARREALAGATETIGDIEETKSLRPYRAAAPAEGERNAVVGYLGQYESAALRTLRALQDGKLVSVLVADGRAGQIDDFQLRLTDRVDAHQIKWSSHPGNVSYGAFVRDTRKRTRYIRQLADGWQRLTKLHSPQRVVVHWVTNDAPSKSGHQRLPRLKERPGRVAATRSFAAFLDEAWHPSVQAARCGSDPDSAVPAEWKDAMVEFKKASGLDETTWRRFVADCELEFNVPGLETTVKVTVASATERTVLNEDADRLAHAFMKMVAQRDKRIEFSRDQLLDKVGWRFRMEFRSSHEFPDPEIPYRRISTTAHELDEAIARFLGGYIAVTGSPGSGKSTLLTRTMRGSEYHVIRYYAFIPGAVGGSTRRGEAVNFFHDLTIALDRIGFASASTLANDDLDSLIARVNKQLLAVHNRWLSGGDRLIVLVDGLDHIPREQRPTQSLIAQLLPPDAVPEGVLFILGTQTDRLEGISARIRAQLDQPGRRVVMRSLERRDVVNIVEDAADLSPSPTPAERDRVAELSGGHPLALNYIINRLRHADGAAVAETLDVIAPFHEAIDEQYTALWATIEDDVDIVRLLALLARARGAVRFDWLRRWAPDQAIHIVTTKLAYLFRREYGERWSFFHNSFRAFLIERTRTLLALGGDKTLFAELADYCLAADEQDPERADELYYSACCGHDARVISLANPKRLREQFIRGRSATTIRDDLRLAFNAAVETRDIVALTRTVLAISEFGQREYYAMRLPLAQMWLKLGDIDLALGSLREGSALRTSRQTALKAADSLGVRGFNVEAREIFLLAEPLDVLRGTAERSSSEDQRELLDAWIAVAPRFRQLADILRMVEDVRAQADDSWQGRGQGRGAADAAKAEEYRRGLLRGLAFALDLSKRWEDADAVRESLRIRGQEDEWWFWTQTEAWHSALTAGQEERAKTRFGVLRESVERGLRSRGSLSLSERTALASGSVRIYRDIPAAKRLLVGVEGPPSADASTYAPNGWEPFYERFEFSRVLGAIGDNRQLNEIVPDRHPRSAQEKEGSALVVAFERGVVQLGRLTGRSWVATPLTPSDFESEARTLIQLFPSHPRLVRGASVATRAREGFYTRLVRAATAYGAGCVTVLQQLFEAEWTNEARRGAWPESLVRTILNELLSSGAPKTWVGKILERIEPTAFRGDELETNLADAIEQARLWAAIDDIVSARRTFDRVLGGTFGIGEKDDQLSFCLGWAVRANSGDPAGAPARLSQMARAVLSLQGARAQRYVAPALLEAGIESGARLGSALIDWALANDVCEWTEAMSILAGHLALKAPAAAGTLSAWYRTAVLPFATSADVETVGYLSNALRGSQLRPDAQELEALSNAIEVVAIASLRPALREAVAGRNDNAAQLLRDELSSHPRGPNQVIDAFEGLSSTLGELRTKVRSVADVEDLVRRLKPDAYFYDWEEIVAPFLRQATADELVAVSTAIPPDHHGWKALAKIAEELIKQGDERAADIVERLVRSSRAAGWSSYFDGGSRLVAYELLTQVSPTDGRFRTWRALQADLAAGEVQAIDLFHSWERIVAMIAPQNKADDIYEVVADHVKALTAFAYRSESATLPSAEDPVDAEAAACVVCNVAARYLDHAATALAHGAQQFFTDRLLVGDRAAEAELCKMLAAPSAPKDGALLVLAAFARIRGGAPAQLRHVLHSLLRSPSYTNRRAALALVDPENRADATVPVIHRPLPATFQVVHSRVSADRRRPILAPGAILPPATDAADLIAVFRGDLDLIAEWANVQPEALYQYVADRAVEYLPEGKRTLAFDDESPLRAEMDRLGLKITYRRPRPRRVERALAEATAMLVDHGALDSRFFPALDRVFRNADPNFVQVRPGVRPDLVRPIPERVASIYVPKEWTQGVTIDASVTGQAIPTGLELRQVVPATIGRHSAKTAAAESGIEELAVDEWIVLAEETWLRWLDWAQATETRVGVRFVWDGGDGVQNGVGHPADWDEPAGSNNDMAAGESLSRYVAAFSHLTVDEYVARARSHHAVVVRNHTYRFPAPCNGWLALNPALAEHMGWRLAEDGLFRWIDGKGNVVAESVWWQDGFSQQHPPRFKDEVGYGWLVRVKRDAWFQIRASAGSFVDYRRVDRHAQDQAPMTAIDLRAVP
jgi:hypothetical protein